MLGRGMLAAFGQTVQIEFRAQATTTASATISKPTGVAVGDVVFVFRTESVAAGNITTSSGSVWTKTSLTWTASGLGYVTEVWWKILNATDVANSWVADTIGGYGAVAFRGNGASAVTVKSTKDNAGSQSTLSLTGYTTSNSRGTVTIIADRDTGGDTVPTGFTSRYGAILNTSWWHGLASKMRFNGSATGTVTWTTQTTAAEVGFLLDVT